MDSADNENRSPENADPTDASWLDAIDFLRVDHAKEEWLAICRCGAAADLIDTLGESLQKYLSDMDAPDAVLGNLSRFVSASRSPTSLLALFERDESALLSLLHLFATSQTLAQFLIDDPEGFDLMRASDGLPAQRRFLVDELVAETHTVQDAARVAKVIENFVHRELVRIAYGEFVRNLSPDQAGRQLAYVADAAIESAIEYSLRSCYQQFGHVRRIDGETPRVTVIGLDSYGGLELNYASVLDVVFLYDAIDEKNSAHRDFYRQFAKLTMELISPPDKDTSRLGFRCDISRGPHLEDSTICAADDAIDLLETKNRTWQRLAMGKARVVGGDKEVGEAFLRRAQPWIYRRLFSQSDLNDIRTLRYKLNHRAAGSKSDDSTSTDQDNPAGIADPPDVVRSAGGRRDIELSVQFLQLLHGADAKSIRVANTTDALVALEQDGCLLNNETVLFSTSYARLCRLHHQLTLMYGHEVSRLPADTAMFNSIAWQLGVRSDDKTQADGVRFREQLSETFEMNCAVINHLMMHAPDLEADEGTSDISAVHVETELLLDPDVTDEQIIKTLSRRGLTDPLAAMKSLRALSVESVPFLSPRRCRQFLPAIAPKLLTQIARTPFPDQTLRSLVEVTDSLGAKATLWELLGANPPTMDLMVRLCASAAYLREILIHNPGMIDELVDSLLMDRLPSGDRLDAQSIELCRGAADVDLILQGFKNSAHLTIGVRDILNKESVESTHRALADTAEACLRRVIENEQATLSGQYGDPVDEDGSQAELLALGLGKFGGREPNYHSDLDVIFLYSAKGQTKRRVGGPRTTITNHQFFNQLAQRVVSRIDRGGNHGPLYELDGRLRPTGDEGTLAVSIDDFLKRFQHDVAPLWQRLALCKARSVSGSRRLKKSTDRAITQLITQTRWHGNMANEIRQMRLRIQETAAANNLKRAEGGTVDVEVIAQMLTLRHAAQSPDLIRQGTVESLEAIAKAGFLPEEQAIALSNSYRTLRRIESRLRLLNTDARHELPNDEPTLKNLAFLLGETDPTMITAQTTQARHTIRKLFDQIFDSMD